MQLRPATSADVAAIAELHAESWRTAYRGIYDDAYLDGDVVEERLRVWTERFAEPPDNQFVMLAIAHDELRGFVCAYGEHDERWGTLVDNLHVRRDQHGRGLGRDLLASSAEWSRERYPGSSLHLWVLDRNANARGFYERMGARAEESAFSEPPGGGKVLGWRYVWDSPDVLLTRARS